MDRKWSLSKETHGQLSLDFMIGIGIYVTAIMFVLAFIPGFFVPFVSNSDDLTMTADRTAATIVDYTLAVRDPVHTSNVYPGILSATEISTFQSSMNTQTGYDQIRERLGLKMTDSALYSLRVIITFKDGTTIDMFNSGDSFTNIQGNVGQSKRFVYVRDLTDPSDYPGRMAIVTVRVW
jgi:hypothetical protein